MHRRQRIAEGSNRKIFYLCALLITVFTIQSNFAGRIDWFPDLILLVVVFTAVFSGISGGLIFGLIAGILRGLLSVNTFPVDVIIFPILGATAAILSKMFYRQSPVTHMLVAGISICLLIIAHTLYFAAFFGNSPGLNAILIGSWRVIISTILISPLVFQIIHKLWTIER